jgi:hypothetical protein
MEVTMQVIVYKISNLINQKLYIGVHKTDNIDDGYMGSGIAIKRAISKYGVENFKKEILFIYDNELDAYLKEKYLLENIWGGPDTYNAMPGGIGSWSYVNSLGIVNCMKDPIVVQKVVNTTKSRGHYYGENRIKASRSNLEKAKKAWTGKTHSEDSRIKISENNLSRWENNRENIIFSLKKFRNKYTLQSPDGIVYELESGTLIDFCKDMGFAVSVFSTKDVGYVVKRGKAKGWKVIDKN